MITDSRDLTTMVETEILSKCQMSRKQLSNLHRILRDNNLMLSLGSVRFLLKQEKIIKFVQIVKIELRP